MDLAFNTWPARKATTSASVILGTMNSTPVSLNTPVAALSKLPCDKGLPPSVTSCSAASASPMRASSLAEILKFFSLAICSRNVAWSAGGKSAKATSSTDGSFSKARAAISFRSTVITSPIRPTLVTNWLLAVTLAM